MSNKDTQHLRDAAHHVLGVLDEFDLGSGEIILVMALLTRSLAEAYGLSVAQFTQMLRVGALSFKMDDGPLGPLRNS